MNARPKPSRAEILHAYPNAVWFVGDPAPIGAIVLTRPDFEGGRRRARVIGLWAPEPTRPRHCQSCTCAATTTEESDRGAFGWFVVEDLDVAALWGLDGRVTYVSPEAEGARPLQSIEYPPTLIPEPEEVP